MKVTQEKLPASQIGLEIEIPAETSKNTYEKVVQNLARSANIPGFRRGKVPRPILLQRLGSQRIKAAVLEEIIQNGFKEALEQEKIESLGNVQIRSNFEELIAQFTPGEPLTFSVAVDVPPTVELGDYKNLKVQAEEIPYDPERLEEWLKDEQEKNATLVPVENRPAQMGDVATVDYQGYFVDEEGKPGEPIPKVQGKDLRVDLVEGRFISGMLEGIVGMKLEETKEVLVTFPDEYPLEEVAGKPSIFSITLKELKAKELPELDDDFAEEVSEFETMAELRESLEEKYQAEASQETQANIQNAIVQELIGICTVDLPETMIQEQVTEILTQTAMEWQRLGLDVKQIFTSDNLPQLRETVRPEAINQLKQALIFAEIPQVESLEVEEDEVAEKMQAVSKQLSERELDLEKLEKVVTEQLLQEKTLDWLQSQATVEMVPLGTLSKIIEESGEEE